MISEYLQTNEEMFFIIFNIRNIYEYDNYILWKFINLKICDNYLFEIYLGKFFYDLFKNSENMQSEINYIYFDNNIIEHNVT